jgi:hypothetical protein
MPEPQMMMKNGILQQIGGDQVLVVTKKHISGGILLTVGKETVLLSPKLASDMAIGVLKALGIGVEVQHA